MWSQPPRHTEKLLSKGDLTYESTFKLSQNVETSEWDYQMLESGEDFKRDEHYLGSGATHRRLSTIFFMLLLRRFAPRSSMQAS